MATDESSWDVKNEPAPPALAKQPRKPPPLPKRRTTATPPPSETKTNRLAAPPPPPAEQDVEADESQGRRRSGKDLFVGSSAFLLSTVTHLLLLILLGIWMLDVNVYERLTPLVVNQNEVEEELEVEMTVPVESELTPTNEMSSAIAAATGGVSMASPPSLDAAVTEQTDRVDIQFEGPPIETPGAEKLISQVPAGTLGDARAVVDNYDEALDRITQEILLMLAKSPVLVIWCFDQSESMKDDQKEIRDRLDRVYVELGLKSATKGGALLTAVTSYGQGFMVHTKYPTSSISEIRDAIDSVPIDPSGKEMMCQAVGESIARHISAQKGGRKMALILVSDESGEHDNNNQFLEPMIAQAKAANCTCYVLGREAVFGYPYAHISWRHPQTGHIHWIPINRGPETGFVEQLQTECFRRRYDAHNSGFGPYEQARLCQQSGGIFFMLPSLEAKLVRGEKRRYDLERMRPYLPDLRDRQSLVQDRQNSILQTVITKVIYDLNPYRPEVAKAMEVAFKFSAKPERFAQQVAAEQTKARLYIEYLHAASLAMEEIKKHREREYDPRWQANYDLIYAQLLAYTARTYEYGAYLENFKTNPKKVPFEKPKFLRLTSWHIYETDKIVGGELTESYIERATAKFDEVIKNHPGTPWAARAQWELSRGFGVALREHYSYYGPRPPSKPGKPRPPLIPVPKL